MGEAVAGRPHRGEVLTSGGKTKASYSSKSPVHQTDLVSPSVLTTVLPEQAALYPEFRYMGSKKRLLPWIHDVLSPISFESAHDPFSGSGCVSYLLKSMGKRVVSTDFLNFPSVLAKAAVENNKHQLLANELKVLAKPRRTSRPGFVEKTFTDVFYTPADLQYIDRVLHNLLELEHPHQQALARSALIRSCLKRQPRGVFTISGDLSRYNDGRRDLMLSIEEHFLEQIDVLNNIVFSNGYRNTARRADALQSRVPKVDLVYLDPPYVPRSDDNCYIKRYHFLEGLSCNWQGDEMEINHETKVKKIAKRFTPFSYRRSALDAFDLLFKRYRHQTIVLSYSSNAYPDLATLESMMGRYKSSVVTHERAHRYHFGTHSKVERSAVKEYLIVGKA